MSHNSKIKTTGGKKKSEREKEKEEDSSSTATEDQRRDEYVQHYLTALNDRHEEKERALQQAMAEQRLAMDRQLAEMQKEREEAAKAQETRMVGYLATLVDGLKAVNLQHQEAEEAKRAEQENRERQHREEMNTQFQPLMSSLTEANTNSLKFAQDAKATAEEAAQTQEKITRDRWEQDRQERERRAAIQAIPPPPPM